MTLGVYSVRELPDNHIQVAGPMHGKYKRGVAAEAIYTHAKFTGREFFVKLPNGENLKRPSLPELEEHLDNVVQ